MRKSHTLLLCVALLLLQGPAGVLSQESFDADATKRAAIEVERAWLDLEIGRFASGRELIFSGELKITQREHDGLVVTEGKALASLSLDSPHTLTILLPDSQRWLRLTQDRNKPNVTEVTRLRALNANSGVSATCTDCIAHFATFKERSILLRLTAQGELLDVARSDFVIELAGHLEPVPPKALRLEQLLLLRPDLDAWLRRPKQTFQTRGREAVRDIVSVLRQRAPSPDGDTVRFTCHYETRYTARHTVNLDDLTQVNVLDLALGDTDLCCVDHARHDGSKICDRGFSQ